MRLPVSILVGYFCAGVVGRVFIVGIGGPSGAGKTMLANFMAGDLTQGTVTPTAPVQKISMDSFYRVFSPEERQWIASGNFSFDDPSAIDFPLFTQVVRDAKEGRRVEVPVYDFLNHMRTGESTVVEGARVLIIEGILALYRLEVYTMMDLRIFVDADPDERLARRMLRDIRERGRTMQSVMTQFFSTVKPACEQYVMPCRRNADIVLSISLAGNLAVNNTGWQVAHDMYRQLLGTMLAAPALGA